MATLQARLTALASAIRDKINLMVPRLMPAGGAVNQVLTRNASADYAAGWVSPAYDVSVPCVGKPSAGEVLLDLLVVRAFTLPQGLAGSGAVATTAPTATATLTVSRNGTAVGTVTFAAGQTTATFSSATAAAFAVGDRMRVIAPSTQDSTLADFTATFALQR
jgi:hypothetical protein